ncbi:coat protein [ssRNA phage SRR6960803_9]|uniref:Coat protein n=1 Tax=ssRNA phage SRR6960803_9 TaxID=2786625 RepID=A0A8S5KZX6_9VIRU|nr:coat protein [ssRNA phage SRR6960803_9]DAD50743.1 TPA_asm: coat protein [ssRNA phage SRR6960803_9]
MTAFANITLNDGQAPPVAHTFIPRRIDQGVAKWQDTSGGIAVGFPTITASLREPIKGSKSPVYKATIKIVYPVLETVSNSTYSGIAPAPTKAYDCVGTVELLLPERAVLQDRKNLRAYVANVLTQVDIKSLVEDLGMIY